MNTTHLGLVKQLVDEIQGLPENLVREVLDFAGYLRAKHDQEDKELSPTWLATFGSWEDTRQSEEIIRDIYAHRTLSEVEYSL